jgi:excinuclease ABC subunit A
MQSIVVRGARQHNLKNIDLEIPRNQLCVVTGLSGSGKSSLAFDTLYAEGQRRYIESLSSYARQFLEQMEKPDVDRIEGLSPAISIEQKTTSRSPRSTVGTITEVYDYLRLLFSSIGAPHCTKCQRVISRQSIEQIVDQVFRFPADSRILVYAPVVRERKGEFRKLFERFYREGYLRCRVDGEEILLEDPPSLDKRRNHSLDLIIDRLLVRPQQRNRLESSIRQALRLTEGLVSIAKIGGEEMLFSERMACVHCNRSFPTLEPRSFSFNSRFGACPVCNGRGKNTAVDLDRLVVNPNRPIKNLKFNLDYPDFRDFFITSALALLRKEKISPTTSFKNLPPKFREELLHGLSEDLTYSFDEIEYQARFRGLNNWFLDKSSSTKMGRRREELRAFLKKSDCPSCDGSRLKPESRNVRINGLAISSYCRMDLNQCLQALDQITLTKRQEAIAGPVLSEIATRLKVMVDIGLSYLKLDREGASLSGGETQRIRLATQLGSQLRGVLYVLDEPSIGLHPRDTLKLLKTLKDLRDLGNTIVLVEHDEDTIRAADYIIDLGPGGGHMGGTVMAQGNLNQILNSPESLTGQYLTRQRKIEIPSIRREGNGHCLKLHGVRHNNLCNIDVSFPLGRFIGVSGVSGSGKSSLVDEVLYRAISKQLYKSLRQPGSYDRLEGLEHIDKVVEIDQSPIGRTPRSNPATYTGVFTPIRQLFSLLPESRIRGYRPGRFSFNVKGGRCEVCKGGGLRKIKMSFLPDVYVECETCRGKRYNRETLSVRYKGRTIADILDTNIEEVYSSLESIPQIRTRLARLLDVGLGYIRLGQSATTLSGGEAQRVRLSRELSKRSTGRTLYILDEPTTGLHFEDVRRLLDILQKLVMLGNTVIVIEHNLEVLKCADYLIDLGPEGGQDGGRLVAQGTPEQVSKCPESYTGQALRHVLEPL